MLKYLRKEKWSPYITGFLIAILAIGSLFLFHKTIGTSTTFVKIAAFFWSIVHPKHLQENPYYQDYLNNFQFFLLIHDFGFCELFHCS